MGPGLRSTPRNRIPLRRVELGPTPDTSEGEEGASASRPAQSKGGPSAATWRSPPAWSAAKMARLRPAAPQRARRRRTRRPLTQTRSTSSAVAFVDDVPSTGIAPGGVMPPRGAPSHKDQIGLGARPRCGRGPSRPRAPLAAAEGRGRRRRARRSSPPRCCARTIFDTTAAPGAWPSMTLCGFVSVPSDMFTAGASVPGERLHHDAAPVRRPRRRGRRSNPRVGHDRDVRRPGSWSTTSRRLDDRVAEGSRSGPSTPRVSESQATGGLAVAAPASR